MVWEIVLAAVIGVLIGGALGALVVRLGARRRARRSEARRYVSVLESLEVLSRALLQGQVDASEASIRMSVLLDCLPTMVRPKVDLAAIHRLASDCANFDRGDTRRALKASDRNRQDVQRLQLEHDQQTAVLAATGRLATVLGEWRQQLQR